jgi:hypothetical protein
LVKLQIVINETGYDDERDCDLIHASGFKNIVFKFKFGGVYSKKGESIDSCIRQRESERKVQVKLRV